MSDRSRVIVALPDAAECSVVADWIAAEGFESLRKTNVKAAMDDLARPFTLLVADVNFAFRDGLHQMAQRRNPSTPTLVVGGLDAERQCDAAGVSAIHVQRPVDQATLVCLMSMAILDGRPARKSERKQVQRFAAMANGAPVHIHDVSYEGVRLEMPADRRTPLPPTFTLRVPLIGVSVNIQRMWSRATITSSGRLAATYCGGALALNPPGAELGWRRFVDNVDSISASPIATVLDIA